MKIFENGIYRDMTAAEIAERTDKIDGYSLDGVKAFLNGTSNHFPIGTHIEVSILCESN